MDCTDNVDNKNVGFGIELLYSLTMDLAFIIRAISVIRDWFFGRSKTEGPTFPDRSSHGSKQTHPNTATGIKTK
jgi:hypothetical protein